MFYVHTVGGTYIKSTTTIPDTKVAMENDQRQEWSDGAGWKYVSYTGETHTWLLLLAWLRLGHGLLPDT